MLLYGVAKTPSQFVLQGQFVLPVLKFVISAYAPGHGPDWAGASTRRANASDQRAGQGWRLVAGSYHRPTRLCGIWVEPARYSYYDLLNLSYRGGGRGDDDQFPSLPCSARAFPQHTDFLLRQRGCARNTWELSKTHEQAPSWACLPATWPATRCRSFSLANSKNLTCASQPSRRGGICYPTNTRLLPGTLVNGLLTATR